MDGIRHAHSKLRTFHNRSAQLWQNKPGLLLGNKMAATIKTGGIFGTSSPRRAHLADIQFEKIAYSRDRMAWAGAVNCNKKYMVQLAKNCNKRSEATGAAEESM
ncbi:uncharacterized protein MAM_07787 [Metarhizium album ARSEF 1941]|uniref:Uncharacterized protein n=1 Tax=Metarhizium album (strain ARSEF 1941) TaxID=1081103 RepID=A0A0B2WKB4_METAS|nr:uncharacterized protein MAM_07787 [Metarhizium album ARSEF 1941]KHN94358.1 hypothetical protein MAM_07787 [Metarhizium album ARSEF 1941]